MSSGALLKSICLTAVLLTGSADAHGGLESDTEVRVEPDRMRVVVRSTIPFAWTLLGERAPRAADEAGQATARPLLAAEAAGLFKVSAGGKTLEPTGADCLFENLEPGHGHVAFTLDFERPAEWPVTLEARFFPRLGELDTGTVAVFDHTGSRFNRDIEPLLRKTIGRGVPSVTFDLRPAAPVEAPAPESSPALQPAVTTPGRPTDWRLFVFLFLTAVAAGCLARAAWRRSRAAS